MTSQSFTCRLLSAAALLCTLSLPVQAETFRCGSRIVSTDSTAAEILKYCGQPASQTVTQEPIRVRNQNGYTINAGHTTTQTLIYARGTQSAPMVVTIVDGKVKSIRREQ